MRRRRDLATSEWFHVSNRGADRQDIFSLVGDHELFEYIIAESIAPYDATIHAYAWMTNHFHLVLRAPDQSLSSIMQRIGKRYGAAYNQRTHRTGPVFDHRFHSVPITDEAHFSQAARYVHRNPLAFVSPQALPNYTGSSLGVFVGLRTPPHWLDTTRLLGIIDPTSYVDELLQVRAADFVPEFGQRTVPCTTDAIDAAVRTVTGVDTHGLRSTSRMLAITIATDVRTDDVVTLASHFGFGPGGVRQASRRGRLRLQIDHQFRTDYENVLTHLSAMSHPYPVRMRQVPVGA